MERKPTKAESSKENGESKNGESGQKPAPRGKAGRGSEKPHSSALPPVYTDRDVALSGALAAAAVLRQQLSAEQGEESVDALRQLDAALTYIEDAPDEAVSCGPNGLGLRPRSFLRTFWMMSWRAPASTLAFLFQISSLGWTTCSRRIAACQLLSLST